MSDCPNGDIRDELPDFLHGQLATSRRAVVAAHLASCAACARELALLRELRGVMHAGPHLDIAKIVAALPAARAVAGKPVLSAASGRFDWRIAAAIVALAVGGGATAILSRAPDDRQVVPPIAATPAGPSQVAAANVSIDAYVSGASAGELEALLDDLESFDGLPAGEPESSLATPTDAEEGL